MAEQKGFYMHCHKVSIPPGKNGAELLRETENEKEINLKQ